METAIIIAIMIRIVVVIMIIIRNHGDGDEGSLIVGSHYHHHLNINHRVTISGAMRIPRLNGFPWNHMEDPSKVYRILIWRWPGSWGYGPKSSMFIEFSMKPPNYWGNPHGESPSHMYLPSSHRCQKDCVWWWCQGVVKDHPKKSVFSTWTFSSQSIGDPNHIPKSSQIPWRNPTVSMSRSRRARRCDVCSAQRACVHLNIPDFFP